MWSYSGLSQGLTNLGPSWCYDWTSTPGAQNFTPPSGVEFVPQAWRLPVHALTKPIVTGALICLIWHECLLLTRRSGGPKT